MSVAKEYFNSIENKEGLSEYEKSLIRSAITKTSKYTIEDMEEIHNNLTTHTFDHIGWEGVEFVLKSNLKAVETLKL